MSNYPEKTCSIERLVRHPKLVEAALAGKKTEQRRDGVYAYPGETFELDGVSFIVTDLKRETLGDMDDESAQAEGYPSIDMYKNLILNMHKGMDWQDDALVWVHCFKRVDAV
ncbi:ASCH domain-containing protein [Ghiorsea bivora]|uniref:ASCH domain-containing protein n=1 Tax=Ghiorsea bivora TaxID=1485545 RepID=UPI00056EF88E|nr:ASCH domain-containing protein [Ghiorsea bivora]